MDSKSIISITADGLSYEDEKGKTQNIDFLKCRTNFSRFMMIENELTEEERINLEQRTKCVALRDAFARPMYIEFLTEPPIRFEFREKLFNDPYKEFRELDNTINEYGWKTFDMG